jgi:hypothetical protein
VLTVKDRRGWCESVEIVGKKTFKLLIDHQTTREHQIEAAMRAAKQRDKSRCQLTHVKRDKYNKVNVVAHHFYSRQHYPDLAASVDNLITLSEEVHTEFHTWNGGFDKPCTLDH